MALATAGATVTEIMGNGSAATPNQSFTLRQTPLTYVQAVTPNGRQSTLQVRANGVAWTEVPTLYEQPALRRRSSPSRTSLTAPATSSSATASEGATLPTGQNNIVATYRIGSGSAGNVAAGAITTLMQRPLGVSGVTNPESATGGADPESIDDVRTNAPQTVLTLGRAVSITDYQNSPPPSPESPRHTPSGFPAALRAASSSPSPPTGGVRSPPGNPPRETRRLRSRATATR